MTQADFEKITKQIEDAHRDPFTEDQFNVWYEQFKSEDYQTVQQATDLLLREYKYFPVPATLWEYIKQVQDTDKAKEESRTTEKTKTLDPKYLHNMKRWGRFLQWCAENKRFPKTEKETEKMKEGFEKNHPNWQPKSRRKKTTKPEPVKDILEDVFGEM